MWRPRRGAHQERPGVHQLPVHRRAPGRRDGPRVPASALLRPAERELCHLASGSVIRVIPNDYKGEAGANPSLTVWTELWGYESEQSRRLWEELTPVPTRDSTRLIETYAGFDGESDLLWELYERGVLQGRRLNAWELHELADVGLGVFEEAPNPDSLVPIWVDEGASLLLNQWVRAESSFVPIEWWDSCVDPRPLAPGDRTALVVAIDAAVTGDCFGLIAVSRHPDRHDDVAVRIVRKWDPPQGGAIDYSEPEGAIRELCARYNVIEVAYDPYQLHDFATRLERQLLVWFIEFPQGGDRLTADKTLYDLIRDRRVSHDGNADLRQHIANANAKLEKDQDSKLRIVKETQSRKIDLAVALSMACWECLRLLL